MSTHEKLKQPVNKLNKSYFISRWLNSKQKHLSNYWELEINNTQTKQQKTDQIIQMENIAKIPNRNKQ